MNNKITSLPFPEAQRLIQECTTTVQIGLYIQQIEQTLGEIKDQLTIQKINHSKGLPVRDTEWTIAARAKRRYTVKLLGEAKARLSELRIQHQASIQVDEETLKEQKEEKRKRLATFDNHFVNVARSLIGDLDIFQTIIAGAWASHNADSCEMELQKNTAGDISDRYATFDEFYEKQTEIFVSLCRLVNLFSEIGDLFADLEIEKLNTPTKSQRSILGKIEYLYELHVWRSTNYEGNPPFEGYFLLGISPVEYSETDYAAFYIPMSRWEECEFAVHYKQAPPYNGKDNRKNFLSKLLEST